MAKYIILNGKVYYIKWQSILYYFLEAYLWCENRANKSICHDIKEERVCRDRSLNKPLTH